MTRSPSSLRRQGSVEKLLAAHERILSRRRKLQSRLALLGVADETSRNYDPLQRTRSELKLCSLAEPDSPRLLCLCVGARRKSRLRPVQEAADAKPVGSVLASRLLGWMPGLAPAHSEALAAKGGSPTFLEICEPEKPAGAQDLDSPAVDDFDESARRITGAILLRGRLEESQVRICDALRDALCSVLEPSVGDDVTVLVCRKDVHSVFSRRCVDLRRCDDARPWGCDDVRFEFEAVFLEPFQKLLGLEILHDERQTAGAANLIPLLVEDLPEVERLSMRLEILPEG